MTVNGFVSLATWDYFKNRATESDYSDEYQDRSEGRSRQLT